MTPDRRGGRISNPGSLNKYSYVLDDPINRNDPSGLCSVMISGVTMGPGTNAAWTAESSSLGADTAYPYSGQDIPTSVASVGAQLLGSNAATYTAYYEILAAEASSSSPVDIIAYSGGGGAFAAAWKLLTSAQQADIGSIVDLTPGSLGASLPSNGSTSTFVGGAGPENGTAGLGTVPVGFVTDTSCSHTDLTCFFNNAAGPLAKIKADGNCAPQQSLTLQQTAAAQSLMTGATQQQLYGSWWQIVGNYYAGVADDFLNWLQEIPVGGLADTAVDSEIYYDF